MVAHNPSKPQMKSSRRSAYVFIFLDLVSMTHELKMFLLVHQELKWPSHLTRTPQTLTAPKQPWSQPHQWKLICTERFSHDAFRSTIDLHIHGCSSWVFTSFLELQPFRDVVFDEITATDGRVIHLMQTGLFIMCLRAHIHTKYHPWEHQPIWCKAEIKSFTFSEMCRTLYERRPSLQRGVWRCSL